nr:proline-rich protein 2-like [Vicugna pacos]
MGLPCPGRRTGKRRRAEDPRPGTGPAPRPAPPPPAGPLAGMRGPERAAGVGMRGPERRAEARGAAAEQRQPHLSAGPGRPRASPAATAHLRSPRPAACPAPRGDSGDPGGPRLGFYRNRKCAQVPRLLKSVVPAFRLTRSLNPSC